MKDDPNEIMASRPLDIIRVIKARNPLDYDLPDGEFISRYELRLLQQGFEMNLPNAKTSSERRAELLVKGLIENKILVEVKPPNAV